MEIGVAGPDLMGKPTAKTIDWAQHSATLHEPLRLGQPEGEAIGIVDPSCRGQ